jgi:hypothetical protein
VYLDAPVGDQSIPLQAQSAQVRDSLPENSRDAVSVVKEHVHLAAHLRHGWLVGSELWWLLFAPRVLVLVWTVIYPLWRREAWTSLCPVRLRFYVCEIVDFGHGRMGYQLVRRLLFGPPYCFGRGRSRAHLERLCAHTGSRRRRNVSTDLSDRTLSFVACIPGTRMPVFGAGEVSPLVACWNLEGADKDGAPARYAQPQTSQPHVYRVYYKHTGTDQGP